MSVMRGQRPLEADASLDPRQRYARARVSTSPEGHVFAHVGRDADRLGIPSRPVRHRTNANAREPCTQIH
jgi:hypothetical protein